MQEHKVARDGEAGSRARSDFLGIMSHELRTPLNAILGYSELMELGISGDLTEVTRKQVGRIRLSAKHLLALVNDILDLAKVEAGRLPINTLPTSVSETLTAAVSMIECQAKAKKVHLAITPGSEALPTYIGDDERVRQILADAVEIQRVVADRHGAQRARLGWNEQAIRREFAIIREELTRLIQEAVPAGGELTVSEATRSLGRFVDQAEHVAVRALNRECGL